MEGLLSINAALQEQVCVFYCIWQEPSQSPYTRRSQPPFFTPLPSWYQPSSPNPSIFLACPLPPPTPLLAVVHLAALLILTRCCPPSCTDRKCGGGARGADGPGTGQVARRDGRGGGACRSSAAGAWQPRVACLQPVHLGSELCLPLYAWHWSVCGRGP